MIAYFPNLYPDELIYSLFARYFAKSGYMGYASAAEDLFANKTTHPDIEFINRLSDEVLSHLQKQASIEELIEKNTMFPYYARFLPRERRKKALLLLLQMDEGYHNLLYLSKGRHVEKYLRYCSLCAVHDRKQYGETYWHRSHQFVGVNICPIHGCELRNSKIAISSKTSPYLYNAEEIIPPAEEVIQTSNDLELKIAKYVYDVFHAPVDMEIDIPVGRFFHSKIEYTKYLSPRGEQRNMLLLFQDFASFFKEIDNIPIKEQWQLQKMMSSDRLSMYEVCLVALFLGVSADELVKMSLPEKTQSECFDEKIRILHEKGLKYPEIARMMGASYDVVKAIGEDRY